MSAEHIASLRPLAGRTFMTASERDAALEKALGADWQTVIAEQVHNKNLTGIFRREYGEIAAYYGDGYLGQTLMIVPAHGIVAVRQVQGDKAYNRETDGFSAFKDLILGLLQE